MLFFIFSNDKLSEKTVRTFKSKLFIKEKTSSNFSIFPKVKGEYPIIFTVFLIFLFSSINFLAKAFSVNETPE